MWRGEVDHEKAFFPDFEQNQIAQLCKSLTPNLNVAGSMPIANLYHFYFCNNLCRRGLKRSLVPSCACYYMSASASTTSFDDDGSSSSTKKWMMMMVAAASRRQQQVKPFSSSYFIICLFWSFQFIRNLFVSVCSIKDFTPKKKVTRIQTKSVTIIRASEGISRF